MSQLKGICRIKEIYVKKDGDAMGSADMQFWLTINGTEHFIGRQTGVEDPKTIKVNQSFEFNADRVVLNCKFKALDEEPHVWGMGPDQVAEHQMDFDTGKYPLPQRSLFIRASDNGVTATVYFELETKPEVINPRGYEFLTIFEHANAEGLSKALDNNSGKLTDTYEFWPGSDKYEMTIREYVLNDLRFPNNTLSSVVMPGNVRAHLFAESLSDSGWLVLHGPAGAVLNLSDFGFWKAGETWNDRVKAIRTFTLNRVPR